MINIEKVRFKNFLSFGSRWQEINFQTGISVVLGLDEDKNKSNGAGKSSFLETITFAFFGQIHKDVKKDDIINWKNRRACVVELNFRKGENSYLIVRGIKPNMFDIYENGNLIDKPAHLRDYQSTLEGIIGLNFQTFMSLIHSNINSSQPVLAMKKPEKRKFIEKIFGLELYSWLNEKTNEKLRTVNDRIRESEIRIEANNNRSNEIIGKIASLEAKIRQTSSTELELRDKKEELKSLQERFEGIEELDDIRGDILSKSTTKAQLQMIIDLIKVKNLGHIEYKVLPPFEQSLKNLKEKMEKVEELQEKVLILENYKNKYISLKNLLEEKSNKRKTLDKIKDDLRVFEDTRREVVFFIRDTKNKISNNELNISSLKENSICPTCGQKIKDVPDEHIEAIRKENEILNQSLEESINKLQEMDENKKIVQGDIEFLEKEVRNLDMEWNYMFNTENELRDMPDVDPNHIIFFEKKIEKYKRVKGRLYSLISRLNTDITKLQTDINLLEERKSSLDNQYRVIRELEEKIEKLKKIIELEKENKKQFQEMLDVEKKNSISIIAENNKLKENIKINKGMIDYFDAMKWVCKDENIKRFAISNMMPYLNSRVNHYLGEVGYGFYVSIDNWLDVTIKGPGIPNGSYGSLSGGEARGVDLALQFAIHDIARLRSGTWPDLIVMDEILDSSIDSKGIEKLMEIISIRQQEERNKIFIISHREEIGESFDADYVYFVVKKDGYSKVSLK